MQDGSNQRLVIYGLLYASLLALHIASSNKSEHLLLVMFGSSVTFIQYLFYCGLEILWSQEVFRKKTDTANI